MNARNAVGLPPRLLVVAGVRVYREGLASGLRGTGAVEVVGSAEDFATALALARRERPHVALLDMEPSWSLALTRRLTRDVWGPAVVALAVPEREQTVIAYAEAGVAGFAPRDASLGDIVEIVRIVRRGDAACSPRVTASLLRRVAAQSAIQPARTPPARLTGRESEILGLLEEGLSNKEIAARLCIEVATVKNHVHNILGKLQVRRRAEAAALFRRTAAVA